MACTVLPRAYPSNLQLPPSPASIATGTCRPVLDSHEIGRTAEVTVGGTRARHFSGAAVGIPVKPAKQVAGGALDTGFTAFTAFSAFSPRSVNAARAHQRAPC